MELREFGWWWSSGRFRAPDDLGRLTATLETADGRLGDVRDALALVRDLLSDDPALAAPVVDLLEFSQRRAPPRRSTWLLSCCQSCYVPRSATVTCAIAL
jgi:hypothetical protein